MNPIELTAGDWVEIYYALELKATLVETGQYGRKDDTTVQWARHLRRIQRTIGVNGEHMVTP